MPSTGNRHAAPRSSATAALFMLWFIGSTVMSVVAAIMLWDEDRGAVAILWALSVLGDSVLLSLFNVGKTMEERNTHDRASAALDIRRDEETDL
jgi:hypothetical protein